MNSKLWAAALVGMAASIQPATAMEPYLPRGAKAFASVDADKNGQITLAEIQPKAEGRFLSLDTDRDGAVTAAEIDAALQKSLERRRNRILSALDADGNGTVSKAELDKYVEALVKGADVDGDGGVSLEEARKFRVAKWRHDATGKGEN